MVTSVKCHGFDCGIEQTDGPGKFSIGTNIGAHKESEYVGSGTDWDGAGKPCTM